MRQSLVAALIVATAAAPTAVQAKIWSKPAWYLVIGKGTQFDPRAPIAGPFADQAACGRELEAWVEMTDGTETVTCEFLDKPPAYDPHTRSS